ncbi:MAG: GAF domain-containing protein [Candidatus Latescibacteria bacterium]|nr:GAF domain-containing protein [Candidatus Latescibacterota bacterium]
MERIDHLEKGLWRQLAPLFTASMELPQRLEGAAQIVADLFAVEACAIYLVDRGTDQLVLMGAVGKLGTDVGQLRVGQGITGLAAYQGRPIQVAQIQSDPRSVWRVGQSPGYRSIVAVPLGDGDQRRGVVNLRCLDERHFSEAEVNLLGRVVAPQILGLLHTAQTWGALQQRTVALNALNELGQALNSGLELDEKLEVVALRAAEALAAKGAIIRLVVEDGTLAQATVWARGELPSGAACEKRIAEYVAATGEPIMVDDVRRERDPSPSGSSLVCVPLVLQERVVGTLALLDKVAPAGASRRLFGVDDLDILFALASQVAAEVEGLRLTVRLQELVRTQKRQSDQLRQVYNRSRALLESISDGLLAVDRDGWVVEMNSVARRIIDQGEIELQTLHVDDLVEDRPSLSQWLVQGGQFSNRVLTLKGLAGKIALMANLQPIIDGERQTSGAVLTFREMGEVGRLVNRVIGVQRTFSFADVVGRSAAVAKTLELAKVAAGTTANILIQGETGTGKEVFAQGIHNASPYSEGPFLAVNCAAIPRDLIESELFGYAEGAFTGASKKGRLGKFELASGGTLFLDEIGDIPLDVQVKLLRVLQEKTIVRVGGDRTIPINCRVIAATHRDLDQAVNTHKFRRDLLYRLNVITIEIPPLRQRREDIPLFIDQFVDQFAQRNGKIVEGVEQEVVERLMALEWQGNVRELENAIEHAVALVKGRLVSWPDLPERLRDTLARGGAHTDAFEQARKRSEESMRTLYKEALKAGQGDVVEAAHLLGISRATLYRRLKKYNLDSSQK